MQLSIRPANKDDFENVFQLLKQLWTGFDLDENKAKSSLLKVLNASNDFAFCALQDNEIVGFIAGYKFIEFWHDGYSCNVSTLIVDSDYRGKNIGTMLLNTVKEWAINEDCQMIALESAFHREKAHSFYEKFGFSKRAFTFCLDLPQQSNNH